MAETAIQDAEISAAESEGLPPVEHKPEAPKVSPAVELRQIQALLCGGIFPGNVAPQIVQAFQVLEKLSVEIEKAAGYVAK